MPVKQFEYEVLLAEYSNHQAAIALLRQHRPYLEMIPSMRRSHESLIVIPLPIVRIRNCQSQGGSTTLSPKQLTSGGEAICLPCDVAILMCDPEWKIKMEVEIFLFIHRPEEDFSDLLSRWRQTQVLLDKDYEWLMPPAHQHIFSEGTNRIYPLFVVFEATPERIKLGLTGGCLPFIIHKSVQVVEEMPQTVLPESPNL